MINGDLQSVSLEYSGDAIKAEEFNHYFHSIFTKEDMSNFDSLKKSLDFSPSLLSTVKFLPQEVFTYLSLIDILRPVALI